MSEATEVDSAIRDHERMRTLATLACELAAASHDERAFLALVARRLSEASGDLCVIRLVSADGLFLDASVAAHHPDPDVLAAALAANAAREPIGESIVGRAAATGEPALVPASLVTAPLRSQGRTIGVMSLVATDPARRFGDEDLRLVTDMAGYAAVTIANARAVAAVRASHGGRAESDEAHRLMFEASPLPLFVFDVDTLAPIAVNRATLELYGYTHEEFMQLKVTEHAVAGRDTAKARLAAWGDAEAAGTSRYRRKDGSEFVAEFTTRALTMKGRRARISVIKDITDRFHAEQSRALLAAIVQSSNDAIVSKGLDGIVTSWNAAAERLFGYSADEMIGHPIAIVIPRDRVDEEQTLLARVAAGDRVDHYETVRRRKDGTAVVVSISLAPILDPSGKVVGASKTARDLTAQRKAADALQRTEAQLRQAQKMEAIGRLAGGVAHDFNNMLSVILCYAELLIRDLREGDPMRVDLGEVHKAALRASELTGHLLLFSRQQVIEPKVLDMNEVLPAMDRMLRRLIGEDVELVSVEGAGLGRVRVDRTNLEQVILNLVVNARDAMPTGGKLTVETANVTLDDDYAANHLPAKPGRYVMLAVTDTGCGMDKDTQARIFEPFFTTKGAGKGTGLGLSIVFGIVQQSGGTIWVYSEPDHGTTFKVYLPRVDAEPEVVAAERAHATLRGTETVLLVEDEEAVRLVARNILRRYGYHVLEAKNAGEALLTCETYPATIHVLLTDVVMPQMSGPELAKRLQRARPGMRVLCMSGYTDDSVVRHGVIEAGMAFLQKPITPETLTRKLRDVIDRTG